MTKIWLIFEAFNREGCKKNGKNVSFLKKNHKRYDFGISILGTMKVAGFRVGSLPNFCLFSANVDLKLKGGWIGF